MTNIAKNQKKYTQLHVFFNNYCQDMAVESQWKESRSQL